MPRPSKAAIDEYLRAVGELGGVGPPERNLIAACKDMVLTPELAAKIEMERQAIAEREKKRHRSTSGDLRG